MEETKELITTDDIRSKVYIIRGQQVMLDKDLAEIYVYEVKKLNQQVKRNIERFPEDFMFRLSNSEIDSVRSQIVTSRKKDFFAGQEGGRRYLPYAFTEQGIYMLATVLRGKLAEQQSIFIMRTFREMRHYIRQNQQFVTRNEMDLLTAKVGTITERQDRMENKVDSIQKDVNILADNFITDKDKKNFVIYKGQKLEADISELHCFRNHPFKVETNTELCELMRSIEKEGVLVPLLVRTNPYGDGYEVISGHRRKKVAPWAGETEVPVVIRELDDDQAVVAMVDSNLHRENLKPSEKAFAYRMKLEAMKHQGKKVSADDITLAQVEPRSAQKDTRDAFYGAMRSNELLSKQIGESVAQIKRYIRLTNLIPKILDMVDEGKIVFTVAVELSYLKEEEYRSI